MKTITLPLSTWNGICAVIMESGRESDKRYAALLREQLDGDVQVKASRNGSVTLKATKGGDLRNSLLLK